MNTIDKDDIQRVSITVGASLGKTDAEENIIASRMHNKPKSVCPVSSLFLHLFNNIDNKENK